MQPTAQAVGSDATTNKPRRGDRNRPRNKRTEASREPEQEDNLILLGGEQFYGNADFQASCSRTAALARLLASALSSRGTWEMEKFRERANFRQIQFSE
jgi:hypothetical protein